MTAAQDAAIDAMLGAMTDTEKAYWEDVRERYNWAIAMAEQSRSPQTPGFRLYVAVNRRNWKIYIGSAKDFKKRMSSHRGNVRKGCMTPIHQAMQAGDDIVFVPGQIVFPTEAAMVAAEITEIAYRRAQNPDIGYNVTAGGRAPGSPAANAFWADPAKRAAALASMPARHAKRRETIARNKATGNNRAHNGGTVPLFDENGTWP